MVPEPHIVKKDFIKFLKDDSPRGTTSFWKSQGGVTYPMVHTFQIWCGYPAYNVFGKGEKMTKVRGLTIGEDTYNLLMDAFAVALFSSELGFE